MNVKTIGGMILGFFLLAMSGPSCNILKDAADKIIEAEAGCTENQLGNLDEPDLPNCSKAVACCKFIKGECGEITLFTPPDSVVSACEANEAVLTELIETYQGMTEGSCPEILTEESCGDGLAQTRQNYVQAVDEGAVGKSTDDSVSCKLIVEETVNKLNDKLGASAKFLPAACEPGTANTWQPEEDLVDE